MTIALPTQSLTAAVAHADDAAAVIEAMGQGPAYVFGTSGGAEVGLDLAARHPSVVRRLVAHEKSGLRLLDLPGIEGVLYDAD